MLAGVRRQSYRTCYSSPLLASLGHVPLARLIGDSIPTRSYQSYIRASTKTTTIRTPEWATSGQTPSLGLILGRMERLLRHLRAVAMATKSSILSRYDYIGAMSLIVETTEQCLFISLHHADSPCHSTHFQMSKDMDLGTHSLGYS